MADCEASFARRPTQMSMLSPVLLSSVSSDAYSIASPPFQSMQRIDVKIGAGSYNAWSSDGQFLAIAGEESSSLHLIRSEDIAVGKRDVPAPAVSIPEPGVSFVCFSPKSAYVCTWRKFTSETDNNMAVWSVATGACLLRSRRKRLEKSAGNPVQFSSDEKTAWLLNGSELLGYDLEASVPDNERRPYVWRLHIPDMIRFWLGPSTVPSYRVVVLVAGKKGQPSKCSIYNVAAFDTVVCSKSFYQSDDVEVFWAPAGHAALVKASAAHDASGQSYYGTSLFTIATATVS